MIAGKIGGKVQAKQMSLAGVVKTKMPVIEIKISLQVIVKLKVSQRSEKA